MDHEARRGGAVDHAVVVGERQRHHQPGDELAAPFHTGFIAERVTPRMATSGALTIGVKDVPPIPPSEEIVNVLAAHVAGRELALARLARELGQLAGDLEQALAGRRP